MLLFFVVYLSTLAGKAWGTLVELRGLIMILYSVLKAEPGKVDIKRLEPGIRWFTLQRTSDGFLFNLPKV